jgi:hypothetical protein
MALDDMIAAPVELDANGLCLQWRNHLGGTPPAHLPRWLLMKILAYRIQATAFGGLDKETLRVLRQPKGHRRASSDLHPFEARIATTREGTKLQAGALLVREWNGRLERVMILDQGRRLERRDLRQPVASRQGDNALALALSAGEFDAHAQSNSAEAPRSKICSPRELAVSYETVRRWVLKFGPLFARELRRRRPRPTSR